MAPIQLIRAQDHVSYIQAEEAWIMAHHQVPPYVHVTLKANPHSYNVFSGTSTFPQSLDPAVPYQACADAVMFMNHSSDVDIITTLTLRNMGYNVASLMEVSDEGHNLFRQARMVLMGALFVKTVVSTLRPAGAVKVY